ncbi:MAG: hypothetical protein FRX48_06119 [Lasallia pustulata]|uniref:Uncharacterized protein n=1 Tax=Lasallia pustulata TaxID=136370 RepID=A0A5M8PP56_9LECA|nr:MAG: hypothetical protein FRX48_06119 [Lasallia pustulata]
MDEMRGEGAHHPVSMVPEGGRLGVPVQWGGQQAGQEGEFLCKRAEELSMSAALVGSAAEIEEPPFPGVGGSQVLRVEEEECARGLVAVCGCSVGGVEEATRAEEDFCEGALGEAEAESVGEEGR